MHLEHLTNCYLHCVQSPVTTDAIWYHPASSWPRVVYLRLTLHFRFFQASCPETVSCIRLSDQGGHDSLVWTAASGGELNIAFILEV